LLDRCDSHESVNAYERLFSDLNFARRYDTGFDQTCSKEEFILREFLKLKDEKHQSSSIGIDETNWHNTVFTLAAISVSETVVADREFLIHRFIA
jgi:hypothetical protein